MAGIVSCFLFGAALVAAGPALPRSVSSLNEAAAAEAQQRDNTATRAFSNTQIKTSDGRCVFVNKLSGDFRENLTPIQVAACGSTDGQGWDVITSGKHINVAHSMLIVSTLTQACFNFDPRRKAGNQVILFSCGGRADGGGDVANSQIFDFNGSAGPLALKPESQAGSCLVVKGNVVDVASCNSADSNQSFSFSGTAGSSISESPVGTAAGSSAFATSVAGSKTSTSFVAGSRTTASPVGNGGASSATAGIPTAQPLSAVPVSRGGNLNPTAAAEANKRDDTATRAFSNAEVIAPNGQCLFVDPTAGDFRENLIPISLVDCAGTPNEKWDIITHGVHNDQPKSALVVSSLVQGCISFDGRRAPGDTVNLFSCGGRADGGGQTQLDQLFPFLGQFSFALAPEGENNKTCILPGDGKLTSGDCPTNGAQLFIVNP